MSEQEFEELLRVNPKRMREKQHEDLARKIMSDHLGIIVRGQKVSILNKEKKFDLVNIDQKVVGDAKHIERSEQGERDNISAYIWLMEKLEGSTGERWRKMIVGGGSKKFFEDYARTYDRWLGDVEIYFLTDDGKIKEIRVNRRSSISS